MYGLWVRISKIIKLFKYKFRRIIFKDTPEHHAPGTMNFKFNKDVFVPVVISLSDIVAYPDHISLIKILTYMLFYPEIVLKVDIFSGPDLFLMNPNLLLNRHIPVQYLVPPHFFSTPSEQNCATKSAFTSRSRQMNFKDLIENVL